MPTTTAKKPTDKSTTKPDAASDHGDAAKLIDTIQQAEQSSIDAVRRFTDAVDRAFPDVTEDGPRHKIIDAAFDMVDQLVRASNDLARDVVKASQRAIDERETDKA